MKRGSSATSQKSVQDARKELRNFLKTLDTVPTEILHEESRRLYAEIIAETPYRTGKLERSVRVAVSKNKRAPGINASASARSPKGYNYAGIQHENLSFAHPVKGKAYYIKDPFDRCIERIREKMRSRLTLGGGNSD